MSLFDEIEKDPELLVGAVLDSMSAERWVEGLAIALLAERGVDARVVDRAAFDAMCAGILGALREQFDHVGDPPTLRVQ